MVKSSKASLKCPPGVMCFENYTLIFIVVVCFIILYLIYDKFHKNMYVKSETSTEHVYHNPFFQHHNQAVQHSTQSGYEVLRPVMKPGISFNNHPTDTLMNPYTPPLQYNQPHSYRQVGYLKNESYNSKMLPIFAKPIHTRRDKWYYYTIFDNIKLPIYSNGRKCSSEYGCDSLMNGEAISLENMNEPFTVHMYDNHTLTYDPHI